MCRHCYVDDSDILDFSNKRAISLIHEIAEAVQLWEKVVPMTRSISFTGGEPLLYQSLFDLVKTAKNNDFFVHLLSNGTLIDKEKAKMVKVSGVDAVQISIDDTEEYHNIIRGKQSSYENALSGARHLTYENIYVTISSTLSKLNFKKLTKLIEIAIKNGASAIRFPRLVPTNNCRALKNELLTPEELKQTYINLLKYKELYRDSIDIITDDPLFSILDTEDNENNKCSIGTLAPGGCSIGFTGICINHDGSVYPCRKLPIKIGNSLEQSFRDIWSDSEILNQIRENANLKGKCSTCHLGQLCKGCRAIAYAMCDDYLAEDKQCWLT